MITDPEFLLLPLVRIPVLEELGFVSGKRDSTWYHAADNGNHIAVICCVHVREVQFGIKFALTYDECFADSELLKAYILHLFKMQESTLGLNPLEYMNGPAQSETNTEGWPGG